MNTKNKRKGAASRLAAPLRNIKARQVGQFDKPNRRSLVMPFSVINFHARQLHERLSIEVTSGCLIGLIKKLPFDTLWPLPCSISAKFLNRFTNLRYGDSCFTRVTFSRPRILNQ